MSELPDLRVGQEDDVPFVLAQRIPVLVIQHDRLPTITTRHAVVNPASVGRVDNLMRVSWPSNSPGWSLQECRDLGTWVSAGHQGWSIDDDGTTKNLTIPRTAPRKFFRLVHP